MNATRVVKIVCLVCPDKFGIHKDATDGVYVRYALLYDANGGMTWIDDPLWEDIAGIVLNTGIEGLYIHSQCQWCRAREASS